MCLLLCTKAYYQPRSRTEMCLCVGFFLCAPVCCFGVFPPFFFLTLLLIKPRLSNTFRGIKISTQTQDSNLTGLQLDVLVVIKARKCCRRSSDNTHEACSSVLDKFTLNGLHIIYILLLLRSPAGKSQSLSPSC